MARRASPPLFELLGDVGGARLPTPGTGSGTESRTGRGGDGAGSSRPALDHADDRGGHRGGDRDRSWPPGGGVEAAGRPERRSADAAPEPLDEPEPARRSGLVLPRSSLYAAGAVLIAIGVLGYSIGFEAGRGAMRAELLGETPDLQAPGASGAATGPARLGGVTEPDLGPRDIVDPIGSGGDTFGRNAGGRDAGRDSDVASAGGSEGAGANGAGDGGASGAAGGEAGGVYHSGGGWRTDDPRTLGTNYLALATLGRASAVEAVDVLGRSGVESVAVRVDGRRSGGNDQDRYVVYSLGLAVPSGRYSEMASQRRSHERRVGEIGRRWSEAGGASAFDQPFWRRFDG